MTEEDLIRLLESRHDLHALADPAQLTADPAFQTALIASRDELAKTRAELVKKVADNTRESSETDTERARTRRLLGDALEHYRYYRGRTQDALLNPPPGQSLDPEEITRRQRLYDRYFKLSPSDIANLGVNKQVEALDALLNAYETEEEFRNLGHAPQLRAAFGPAIDATQEYHRETHEDRVATATLAEARLDFDRAHAAHTRQVDSLLIRARREDDARHFIKRRDPGYAARRRTRSAVAQEPEASTIESEVRGEDTVPA